LKKRRRSRAFLYSFVGTLLVLVLLFLAVYETPPEEVTTETIPSTLPQYTAPWGPFVPATALQMGFENFTMIRQANQSIVPDSNVILNITSPSAVIRNADLVYHLDVVVATPNSSYDVLFLKPSSFARVSTLFGGNGQKQDGGAASLFNVTDSSGGSVELSWVGLFPSQRALAFSAGQVSGQQALDIAFDSANGSIPEMISYTSIPQMLYTVGGAEGHFAIGIQNFPGLVSTGLLTLIAVDPLQTYTQTSFVVQFANPSTASAQVQTMKNEYLSSHDFTVYGSNVRAIVLTKSGALEAAVQQVG
jgi:hypothetical protein